MASAFSTRFLPRVLWYGALLAFAGFTGGVFARAALEVFVGMNVMRVMLWLLYTAAGIDPKTKTSLGGTLAYTVAAAAISAYFFNQADSGGGWREQRVAYGFLLIVGEFWLLYFEFNREADQATSTRHRVAKQSLPIPWRPTLNSRRKTYFPRVAWYVTSAGLLAFSGDLLIALAYPALSLMYTVGISLQHWSEGCGLRPAGRPNPRVVLITMSEFFGVSLVATGVLMLNGLAHPPLWILAKVTGLLVVELALGWYELKARLRLSR